MGTLYSGESEFDECVASIQRQTYKDFDHFVFKDLPNREAHHALFKSFLDRAADYDILIKVDADMVLCSDTLFDRIVRKLSQSDNLDVLGIGVHDFFSGQLINGLNAYRNTVRWDFERETMFVDIPEVPQDRCYYDDKELAPAAIHCKNPAPWQAFHYGVHRGLKSIQPQGGSAHWALLEQTRANFRRTGDIRIGLASLGAELAYTGHFKVADVDYTNSRLKEVLEDYAKLDVSGLEREIGRLRRLNWGFLPSNTRRNVVRHLRRPK